MAGRRGCRRERTADLPGPQAGSWGGLLGRGGEAGREQQDGHRRDGAGDDDCGDGNRSVEHTEGDTSENYLGKHAGAARPGGSPAPADELVVDVAAVSSEERPPGAITAD